VDVKDFLTRDSFYQRVQRGRQEFNEIERALKQRVRVSKLNVYLERNFGESDVN
jgi:hypothetical protein